MGKFYVKKLTITYAQSFKSLNNYAIALLEGFFKKDITLFCSCRGSKTGISRARLPKVPFKVFLGNCFFV
jgi:hypothetical protein